MTVSFALKVFKKMYCKKCIVKKLLKKIYCKKDSSLKQVCFLLLFFQGLTGKCFRFQNIVMHGVLCYDTYNPAAGFFLL